MNWLTQLFRRCANLIPQSVPSERLTETQLENILLRASIDWSETIEEAKTRLGVSRYYNWGDIIQWPAVEGLVSEPLIFYSNYSDTQSGALLQYIAADFDRVANARANFKIVSRVLKQKFGAPRDVSTSNCLVSAWNVGMYDIVIHAWLPELNRGYKNELITNNPGLKNIVRIRIERRTPRYRVNKELERIVGFSSQDVVQLSEIKGADALLHLFSGTCWHASINPHWMSSTQRPFLWRHGAVGLIGLSDSKYSIVVKSALKPTLEKFIASPARGPGYVQLSLKIPKPSGICESINLSDGNHL